MGIAARDCWQNRSFRRVLVRALVTIAFDGVEETVPRYSLAPRGWKQVLFRRIRIPNCQAHLLCDDDAAAFRLGRILDGKRLVLRTFEGDDFQRGFVHQVVVSFEAIVPGALFAMERVLARRGPVRRRRTRRNQEQVSAICRKDVCGVSVWRRRQNFGANSGRRPCRDICVGLFGGRQPEKVTVLVERVAVARSISDVFRPHAAV